jgi:hypothetical protein
MCWNAGIQLFTAARLKAPSAVSELTAAFSYTTHEIRDAVRRHVLPIYENPRHCDTALSVTAGQNSAHESKKVRK